MIEIIAVNMGLISRIRYVKDNNPKYYHLPWELYTFVFIKSLISLKIPKFTTGFPQSQVLPAAVPRISSGKSWQFSIYSSRSLVSVCWYSWLTSYEVLLYDTAVDTLNFCRSIIVKHLWNTNRGSRIQPIERWYVVTVRTCATVTYKTF